MAARVRPALQRAAVAAAAAGAKQVAHPRAAAVLARPLGRLRVAAVEALAVAEVVAMEARAKADDTRCPPCAGSSFQVERLVNGEKKADEAPKS